MVSLTWHWSAVGIHFMDLWENNLPIPAELTHCPIHIMLECFSLAWSLSFLGMQHCSHIFYLLGFHHYFRQPWTWWEVTVGHLLINSTQLISRSSSYILVYERMWNSQTPDSLLKNCLTSYLTIVCPPVPVLQNDPFGLWTKCLSIVEKSIIGMYQLGITWVTNWQSTYHCS